MPAKKKSKVRDLKPVKDAKGGVSHKINVARPSGTNASGKNTSGGTHRTN
jgi:hypothetical protein